jgi:hypothetical protein
MSFATNGVLEKAGSAGLKRDENVAHKDLCLGPRRRSVAWVPAVERLVWAEAEGVPGPQRAGAAVIFENLAVIGVSIIGGRSGLVRISRRGNKPS